MCASKCYHLTGQILVLNIFDKWEELSEWIICIEEDGCLIRGVLSRDYKEDGPLAIGLIGIRKLRSQ